MNLYKDLVQIQLGINEQVIKLQEVEMNKWAELVRVDPKDRVIHNNSNEKLIISYYSKNNWLYNDYLHSGESCTISSKVPDKIEFSIFENNSYLTEVYKYYLPEYSEVEEMRPKCFDNYDDTVEIDWSRAVRDNTGEYWIRVPTNIYYLPPNVKFICGIAPYEGYDYMIYVSYKDVQGVTRYAIRDPRGRKIGINIMNEFKQAQDTYEVGTEVIDKSVDWGKVITVDPVNMVVYNRHTEDIVVRTYIKGQYPGALTKVRAREAEKFLPEVTKFEVYYECESKEPVWTYMILPAQTCSNVEEVDDVNQRRGKFTFTPESLKTAPHDLMQMFWSKVVPYWCTSDAYYDTMSFYVKSKYLPVVPEGSEAPEYTVTIDDTMYWIRFGSHTFYLDGIHVDHSKGEVDTRECTNKDEGGFFVPKSVANAYKQEYQVVGTSDSDINLLHPSYLEDNDAWCVGVDQALPGSEQSVTYTRGYGELQASINKQVDTLVREQTEKFTGTDINEHSEALSLCDISDTLGDEYNPDSIADITKLMCG